MSSPALLHRRLLISPAAKTLVLHGFESVQGLQCGRAYSRSFGDSKYAPLQLPAPNESDESPCISGSLMATIRMTARTIAGVGTGKDFKCVTTVDLVSRVEREVCSREALETGHFLSELLHLSADERLLYAIVGRYIRQSDATVYGVASVSLDTARLTWLDDLSTPFG